MTVSFISKSTILVINEVDTTTISKLSNLGVATSVIDDENPIAITDSSGTEFTFTEDGVYKITPETGNSIIVIIYNDIFEYLKADIKDILLNVELKGLQPNMYDVVLLTLIASTILTTSYQLTTYNVDNMEDYINLVLAIEQCNTYMDIINNTPQSTSKIWL